MHSYSWDVKFDRKNKRTRHNFKNMNIFTNFSNSETFLGVKFSPETTFVESVCIYMYICVYTHIKYPVTSTWL
jgi:hypothetical protein